MPDIGRAAKQTTETDSGGLAGKNVGMLVTDENRAFHAYAKFALSLQ